MAFVLTAERLRARVAPLPRRDLAAKVALVRDLVQRPGSDWRSPAQSLAGSLLEPLEKAGWLSGKPHLYLVPPDLAGATAAPDLAGTGVLDGGNGSTGDGDPTMATIGGACNCAVGSRRSAPPAGAITIGLALGLAAIAARRRRS